MPAVEAPSRFRALQDTLFMRLLLRCFFSATKYLPVWFMRAAAVPVSFIFLLLTFRNFLSIRKNIKHIDPEATGLKTSVLAAGVYKNFSFYLIDLFYIGQDHARLKGYDIKITGDGDVLKKAPGAGGAIVLTTHLGNWEMAGLVLASKGEKVAVVYSPDSSGLLERQRGMIRENKSITEIPLKPGEFSAIKLMRMLESGLMVAIQGDRLLFDKGLSLPFLGGMAAFPKGPVKLAMLTGSVVIPVFAPMTGYKSYEIIVESPVSMDPSATVEENLLRITSVMEKYISLYPSQWYTFTEFWQDGPGQ